MQLWSAVEEYGHVIYHYFSYLLLIPHFLTVPPRMILLLSIFTGATLFIFLVFWSFSYTLSFRDHKITGSHRLLTKWMLHLCICLGQEEILLCSLHAISDKHASFRLEVSHAVPHWVPIVPISLSPF